MKKDKAPGAGTKASNESKRTRPKKRATNKAAGGGDAKTRKSRRSRMVSDAGKKSQIAADQTPVRAERPREEKPGSGDNFLRELGEAALYFLPGSKTKYANSPHWWDSFLLLAKSDPDAARVQMLRMGEIARGSIQSLVEWSATTKHLPKVQSWAQTCLADLISWLEDFGYVSLKQSAENYGAAFHERWKEINPDGRGPSKFAVVHLFADELLWKSDAMLNEILGSYPAPLPDDAPASKKSLWLFVDGCVKWRIKEGDKFVEDQGVRHMFEHFRRHEITAITVWEEHLWPLMQEMWPSWIRETGREEFVGFGKFKFGLPLTLAKRKNEKLCLEPSQWKDAVRGHIKRKALFEKLFFGEGGKECADERSDAPPES